MVLELLSQSGKQIKLEKLPIGKGGQGAVYRVQGDPYSVAKLYKDQSLAFSMEKKIKFMVGNPPFRFGSDLIKKSFAWPKDLLFNRTGDFVGFLMENAMDSIDLHELTLKNFPRPKSGIGRDWNKFKLDPSSKTSRKNRLALCLNIAKAVSIIHDWGKYVIVDLKPQNIRLKKNGYIVIIDLDNLQVAQGNKLIFGSQVITEEYIPPEGQDKTFPHKELLTSQWDYFSFAVIVYQLLLGLHPYVQSHPNFQTLPKLIKHDLYVHGGNKSTQSNISSAHNEISHYSKSIRDGFVEAFKRSSSRPSFQDWELILKGEIDYINHNPQIITFFANGKKEVKIGEGKPLNLEWQVRNFLSLDIIQGDEIWISNSKDGHNKKSIYPTQSGEIKLKVFGQTGLISESGVSIKVAKKPRINIKISSQKVFEGEDLEVSWVVKNADRILVTGESNPLKRGFSKIKVNSNINFQIKAFWIGSPNPIIESRQILMIPIPKVEEFRFSTKEIYQGESIEIFWKVKNSEKVYLIISGEKELLQKSGRKLIKLEESTWINLLLIGNHQKKVQVQKQIKVHKRPQIVVFTPAFNQTINNSKIKINFEALNFQSLVLVSSHGERWNVSNQKSKTVKVSSKTNHLLSIEFHLEIESTLGQIYNSKKILVEILPEPQITFFHANPSKILDGSFSILVWEINFAEKCYLKGINGEIKEVSPKGSLKIYLKESVIVELTAQSIRNICTVTKYAEVLVFQKVTIKQFGSDSLNSIEGMRVNLSWDVRNHSKLILLPNNIDVTGLGSKDVFPEKSTTFKLVASNDVHTSSSEWHQRIFQLPPLPRIIIHDSFPNLKEITPPTPVNRHIYLDKKIFKNWYLVDSRKILWIDRISRLLVYYMRKYLTKTTNHLRSKLRDIKPKSK